MSNNLTDQQIQDYVDGSSIKDLALTIRISHSCVRNKLFDAGVLRTSAEATRLRIRNRGKLPPPSRLTAQENGIHYDAVLSQLWISKSICN